MWLGRDPNLGVELERRIERVLAELERGGELDRLLREFTEGGLPKKFRGLFVAQRGGCAICRELMVIDAGRAHDLAPSIEHVVPRSRGGVLVRNVLLSHRLCNSLRQDRPATEAMLRFQTEVYARLAGWARPARGRRAARPEIAFLTAMGI